MRRQTEHLKTLILAYLEANCRGRRAGVSRTKLALALSVPLAQERRLREALDALADEHPIGSSPEHGYFLCQDAQDFAVAAQTIAGYAYPSLRRLEAIKRHQRAKRREQLGVTETRQASLFEAAGATP